MRDDLNDAQALAELCGEKFWPLDRVAQELDMSLDAMGPGTAVLSMNVAETMMNGHGTCHGGYIFMLADTAFAYACNSFGQNTVAAAADISFVNPASLGDRLRADARMCFQEGRNGIYDVEVTNQSGSVVALFRGKSRTIKGSILDKT